MSNHFTGLSLGPPLGDQRLDLCDLYAFGVPGDREVEAAGTKVVSDAPVSFGPRADFVVSGGYKVFATEDVISIRVAFLTKNEAPPTGLTPHTDTLGSFPYLGKPHPTRPWTGARQEESWQSNWCRSARWESSCGRRSWWASGVPEHE